MKLSNLEFGYHVIVVAIGIALGGTMLLTSCGKANGDDKPTVLQINAPDGSNCYVIMQGAQAIGGNCR